MEYTTTLAVRLTPRASRSAVTGYADGTLHLRLSAPPVEGAANAACCAFVADLLGLPKARVSLKSGHKNRNKVLVIEGLTAAQVSARLTPDASGTSFPE